MTNMTSIIREIDSDRLHKISEWSELRIVPAATNGVPCHLVLPLWGPGKVPYTCGPFTFPSY